MGREQQGQQLEESSEEGRGLQNCEVVETR